MMDVRFWSSEEEKGVMIHELETAVQMHESDHIMAIGVMIYLKEEIISGSRVEVNRAARVRTLEGLKLK